MKLKYISFAAHSDQFMLSFRILFSTRRYFAPAFLYSCFSLIFSTWVVYIPYISDRLKITEGRLGGALFFTSVGALLIIPVINRFVDKAGVGRSAFFSFILYGLSLYGMFLATSYVMLCVALLIFGMMGSAFAISINSLTATLEKRSGMFIMTGSHGFWSLGGMTGAATGSFISARLGMPLLHISVLLLILFGLQFWLKKEYFQTRSEYHEKARRMKFRIRPLLVIASIGLVIMLSEGAIADWSALYLKKIVLLKNQYIGFGYALFSLGMAVGRFTGDSLSSRFGSWSLLRRAFALSLTGFVLVLLSGNIILPLAGFFIVGLGFSVIVPEVYRLASRVDGIRTADGVSFIAATANIGFLIGPVVLGFIAELRSLHLSFIILTLFVSFAFGITLMKKST